MVYRRYFCIFHCIVCIIYQFNELYNFPELRIGRHCAEAACIRAADGWAEGLQSARSDAILKE